MAKLKMASYTYTDSLSESRLPSLQAPKVLSRLEVLRNEYQERNLRHKEEKMMMMLTEQQERISQRMARPSLHNAHPTTKHKIFQEFHEPQHAYPHQWGPEERAWASNWTVSKRTAGVDRAHPLKPVYHYRPTNHASQTLHPPSAQLSRHSHFIPGQELLRSKSGPSRTESWQQLERKESSLETEIRKKEALLREKLRKTEEDLRRIQREKEDAEMEERRVREKQNKMRMMATRPQNRTINFNRYPDSSEEEEEPKTLRQGLSSERMRATRRQNRTTNLNRYPESSEEEEDPKVMRQGLSSVRMRATRSQNRTINTNQHLYSSQEEEEEPKALAQGLSSERMRQSTSPGQNSSQSPAGHSSHRISVTSPSISASRPLLSTAEYEEGNSDKDLEDRLLPCHLCGRYFSLQRLEKHTGVCQKMHTSKRKVFDSSKARAKGTDLEQYLSTKGRPSAPPPQVKKNSWQQKHEAFIRTIRQAREVQNIIARGGKASDLPPPPPEENPDYIACPHCTRRFAPRVAERHIPKCETIKNKPRPPPTRRR
ncbi:zinc finger C2HC domain-containing protein 1C [Hyperolius riggenbachi]|uniref:zinc finger C2HC domain-containing protein 1C n=1 Tax=Hyperolius riggenbachi TaxID=752182 RepID=UPI0035A2E49B